MNNAIGNLLKTFLKMPRTFSMPVKILLLCAIGRALVVFTLLPFLPIYLTKILEQSVDEVGYLLGVCLLFGTLVSVYGGYLADKQKKIQLMCFLVILMAVLSISLAFVKNIWIILLVLILFNTCSSCISVTCNALFSELLSIEERNKVFSLRYSLENIGAAIGPFLGVWAVQYGNRGPFILAGFFALIILMLLIFFKNEFRLPIHLSKKSVEDLNFTDTLRALHLDKRLILFTLGGILSMAVYGPLLTYLSQYLVATKTVNLAYQTIAYVSAANALVVISLQYIIGSQIKKELLMRWLSLGVIAFVVGLFGLSTSSELLLWIFAIIIFTLGEIIIVPAEYMFVDSIAPEHLKGVYFGTQNLIFVGMALGPILCGNLLKYTNSQMMFYVLIGVTVLSWLFYYLGYRKQDLTPTTFNSKRNSMR